MVLQRYGWNTNCGWYSDGQITKYYEKISWHLVRETHFIYYCEETGFNGKIFPSNHWSYWGVLKCRKLLHCNDVF